MMCDYYTHGYGEDTHNIILLDLCIINIFTMFVATMSGESIIGPSLKNCTVSRHQHDILYRIIGIFLLVMEGASKLVCGKRFSSSVRNEIIVRWAAASVVGTFRRPDWRNTYTDEGDHRAQNAPRIASGAQQADEFIQEF